MAEFRKQEKEFAPRCQWPRENLPLPDTDVIKWRWWPLQQKCQI